MMDSQLCAELFVLNILYNIVMVLSIYKLFLVLMVVFDCQQLIFYGIRLIYKIYIYVYLNVFVIKNSVQLKTNDQPKHLPTANLKPYMIRFHQYKRMWYRTV